MIGPIASATRAHFGYDTALLRIKTLLISRVGLALEVVLLLSSGI